MTPYTCCREAASSALPGRLVTQDRTHNIHGRPGLGPDEPLDRPPPISLSQPPPDMAKLTPLSPELLWNFFCYTA